MYGEGGNKKTVKPSNLSGMVDALGMLFLLVKKKKKFNGEEDWTQARACDGKKKVRRGGGRGRRLVTEPSP